MNKFKFLIPTFFLFFSVSFSIQSQSYFEGKIKFKITQDDEVAYMDYFMKEDKIRLEVGDNSEAVFITNSKGSLLLMPEEKMYMDLNKSVLNNFPGMNKTQNEESNTEEEIDFTKYKTGKVKSISGYECHQWVFKEEDDNEVEAWLTDELGNFMLMQNPMGGGYSPGWSSSVKNSGFFPLLVVTKDEDGEEISRFEASEIKEESLSDEIFTPPPDYSEMKIPGMDSFFK